MLTVVLNVRTFTKDRRGFITDHGTDLKTAEVNTLREASQAVGRYISDNLLGSSTFTGGDVYHKDTWIACVSYNGRVWGPGNFSAAEITGDALDVVYD
jgi:hypothetical protein